MRINYHVCANSLSLQLEDGEADLQKGKIAHLNAAWHYWAINENCCSVLIRDVRSRGWGYYSFHRLEGNSFSCSSCSHRRERGGGGGEKGEGQFQKVPDLNKGAFVRGPLASKRVSTKP